MYTVSFCDAFLLCTLTAQVIASAAEVDASYMLTLDIGKFTNSETMVWNSHIA